LLNLALGGGWAQNRIINVVGDRSTGKTGLAIEACANFACLYGAEHIRYAESESAFDDDYARIIGLPDGLKVTGGITTVEEFYNDLLLFCKEHPQSLYVLDSLDALSDSDEMGRQIGEATYGTSKARKLSELFRRAVDTIARAQCTLMIISQVRDKIGVAFGETKTRSGGRALDFYASQIVWLSEVAKIKRSAHNHERVVGIQARARVRKNKLAAPHREADFLLLFNYGIDDEQSLLDWLKKHKALGDIDENRIKADIRQARKIGDRAALGEVNTLLTHQTRALWEKIEAAVAPTMQKYG